MASPLALSDRSWGTRGRGSPGSGRIDRTSFLRLVEEIAARLDAARRSSGT
ncbi:MAG: hypothetical protein GX837_06450 [Methanomicrobiales archaeon]|nr:hypothetical protein [Methanomicrobiales archaeon]